MLANTDSWITGAVIGWENVVVQSGNRLLIHLQPKRPCVNKSVSGGFGQPEGKRFIPEPSTCLVNMSKITGFLRRTFGIVREHVGADHFGNNYYIIPAQKTWTGITLLMVKLSVFDFLSHSCSHIDYANVEKRLLKVTVHQTSFVFASQFQGFLVDFDFSFHPFLPATL